MSTDRVQKVLVAVLDDRTTLICVDAHGQVQNADQPYQTVNGAHLEPPFHWFCRSISDIWTGGLYDRFQLSNEGRREKLHRLRESPRKYIKTLRSQAKMQAPDMPTVDLARVTPRLVKYQYTKADVPDLVDELLDAGPIARSSDVPSRADHQPLGRTEVFRRSNGTNSWEDDFAFRRLDAPGEERAREAVVFAENALANADPKIQRLYRMADENVASFEFSSQVQSSRGKMVSGSYSRELGDLRVAVRTPTGQLREASDIAGTMVHELAHAMQIERHAGNLFDEVRRAYRTFAGEHFWYGKVSEREAIAEVFRFELMGTYHKVKKGAIGPATFRSRHGLVHQEFLQMVDAAHGEVLVYKGAEVAESFVNLLMKRLATEDLEELSKDMRGAGGVQGLVIPENALFKRGGYAENSWRGDFPRRRLSGAEARAAEEAVQYAEEQLLKADPRIQQLIRYGDEQVQTTEFRSNVFIGEKKYGGLWNRRNEELLVATISPHRGEVMDFRTIAGALVHEVGHAADVDYLAYGRSGLWELIKDPIVNRGKWELWYAKSSPIEATAEMFRLTTIGTWGNGGPGASPEEWIGRNPSLWSAFSKLLDAAISDLKKKGYDFD